MLWGIGVVGALGLVTWLLRAPGSAPLGRAFGALVFYGVLFWLSLLKVWWTGGRAVVVLDEEKLAYQPLHSFKRREIPYDSILACAPRRTTQSLRLVHQWKTGEGREFFLNLAVIQGRHEFLDMLGEQLERAGLEPVVGEKHTWRRPGIDSEAVPI